MKSIFLVFSSLWIAITSSISANSNNGTLHGKITLGETKITIDAVQIYIKELHHFTVTDRNGNFTVIDIAKGLYQVEISMLGYKKEKITVEIRENATTEVELNLKETSFYLDEVVVTGTLQKHLLKETPVITEVLTQRDLLRSGSSELGEILHAQTGIDLSTGIGQTQNISLQGLRKNHVLVLVDGERISGKIDDAVDINQIPPQTIERIEIVKGPMSSVYGSEAIGGVVNIITKEPQYGITAGDGSITVGSNGRQDYNASFSHSLQNIAGERSSLNFLLFAGWNKYFGIDYNTKDYIQEMPEFDKKNISLKVNGSFNNALRFDIKTDYYQDNLEWQAGGDQYVHFIDYAFNTKKTLTSSIQYTIGTSTILKASGNYSTNDHGANEKTGKGFLVSESSAQEKLTNGKFQVTFLPYSTSTMTIGVESQNESIASTRLLSGGQQLNNSVLFAEDEWTIHSLTLNIGARYSNNSRYGEFFAPRFSAMYKFTERLTLRGSYGRGFRSPSLLELFIDFDHSTVGYMVKGNPLLQPEASHGFNLGFDYAREEIVWFRVNGYYNSVSNLINYYYVTPNPVVFSYRNIAAATTRGVDLDIDFRMLQPLSISIGYNYNNSVDGFGNILPFHSPHTLNTKFGYEIPSWGSNVFLQYRWFDSMPVVDEQTNTDAYNQGTVTPTYYYTSAYAVLDMTYQHTIFSSLNISAGVKNLLNKIVYPFGQTKGREFFAGLRYQF